MKWFGRGKPKAPQPVKCAHCWHDAQPRQDPKCAREKTLRGKECCRCSERIDYGEWFHNHAEGW